MTHNLEVNSPKVIFIFCSVDKFEGVLFCILYIPLFVILLFMLLNVYLSFQNQNTNTEYIIICTFPFSNRSLLIFCKYRQRIPFNEKKNKIFLCIQCHIKFSLHLTVNVWAEQKKMYTMENQFLRRSFFFLWVGNERSLICSLDV